MSFIEGAKIADTSHLRQTENPLQVNLSDPFGMARLAEVRVHPAVRLPEDYHQDGRGHGLVGRCRSEACMFSWLKDRRRRRSEKEWNGRFWEPSPPDDVSPASTSPAEDSQPACDSVERQDVGQSLHFFDGGHSGGGGASADWDSSCSSDAGSDGGTSDSGGGDSGGAGGGSSD